MPRPLKTYASKVLEVRQEKGHENRCDNKEDFSLISLESGVLDGKGIFTPNCLPLDL